MSKRVRYRSEDYPGLSRGYLDRMEELHQQHLDLISGKWWHGPALILAPLLGFALAKLFS
ncbi:MAG: hypothetical protein AB7L09_01890 [Nitrospira sp.]